MRNQNLTIADATSVTAQHVAALLVGPASVGGPTLAARPCPAPVTHRLAGSVARPAVVPPISVRTRGLSAAGAATASGAVRVEAWMPTLADADHSARMSVFIKHTSYFAKHHPGDRALRPPV